MFKISCEKGCQTPEDCEEQDDDVGINADDYFKNIRSDNQYVINNLKIMKKIR